MTLPGPAAVTGWPRVPAISMPRLPPASLKPLMTLPCVGHAQAPSSATAAVASVGVSVGVEAGLAISVGAEVVVSAAAVDGVVGVGGWGVAAGNGRVRGCR